MLVPKLKCKNCGYTWTPRINNPKKCPKCGHFIEKLEELLIEA